MWAGYHNLKENVHLNSKADEMGDDRRRVGKDSPGSDYTRVETVVQVIGVETPPPRREVVDYQLNFNKSPMPTQRPSPPELKMSTGWIVR